MGSVELRGLGKVFPNGVEAVAGIDLTVGDGEFLAVVGPSGSGKSTLLRLIAGLESPTTGSVSISGREVTGLAPRERKVAMVFQDPALFPYLSVFDNLAFGLRARGYRRGLVNERVNPVAEILDLAGVLDRRPDTLSGGQRQRVALGRAVANQPAVFLLDEPLSRLDAPLRASLRDELTDLHRRLGATMILVTHDQAEALAMGDRVAVFERGRIVQVGTPVAVYRDPINRAVAGFIGNPPMSFYHVRIVNEDGPIRVRLPELADPIIVPAGRWLGPLAARRGGKIALGLRPEHVILARDTDAKNSVYAWLTRPAEVVRVEFQGHELAVVLGLHSQEFRARVPGSTVILPDAHFAIGLDLNRASWFDPDTGEAIAPGHV